jgi:hypothetical protein
MKIYSKYRFGSTVLDMDVDTGKLTVDLSDSTKITAQVEYSLTMSGQETSRSGIKIEVFI